MELPPRHRPATKTKPEIDQLLNLVADLLDPRPKSSAEEWDIQVRAKDLTKREPQ